MAVDWLLFQTDADSRTLYLDIQVGRFLELLPDDPDEVDEFCQEFYPILDEIQGICLQNGLKQICTMDISEVGVRSLRPTPILKVLWNIDEHSRVPGLLKECEIYGGGRLFNTLLRSVNSLLPSALRGIVTVVQDEDLESDDDT